jgi:hypothetical protein
MQDVPQERLGADTPPSSKAMSPVCFAGLIFDLGACTLARESGEAIPLTPRRIPAFAPVYQSTGPRLEPRRHPGGRRQPAARTVRPQRGRAGCSLATQA